MSSVGTYLRDLRQRKGVSLEEIARTTRVAQRYLESIEADAFDTLPSPVFTRGFIRAYCQALSEPPDEALAAYEGRDVSAPPPPGRPGAPATRPGTGATRAVTASTRHAATSTRTAEGEPRGRGAVLVSFVLLVVLGIALFAVALVIHPRDRAERVASEPRQESRPVRPPGEPTPSVPAAAQPPAPPAPSAPAAKPPAPGQPTVAAPRPAPAATPASPPSPAPAGSAAPAAPPAVAPAAPPAVAPRPAPATPPAPAVASAPPVTGVPPPVTPGLDAIAGSVSSPYRLVARTNEATWIRVRTEDGRTSEENVPAGEVREWISNRPFTLTIGNAGGVSFELNGRALPPLGPRGAVIQRLVLPPEAR